MKFYYKERTAKNQCKVLSEEKGMLTIQMRNGGRFLVSKRNILKENQFATGPGRDWLNGEGGDQLSQIAAKLKQIEKNFASKVKYDANDDPDTEAVHSTLVALWSIVGSVADSDFEGAGKTMGNQGKYMLRTLV
jgi:hypothetical protein